MVAAYESQVAYSVRVQCEQERVDDVFEWLEENFPDLTVDVGDPFARVGEVFVFRPYEGFSGEGDLSNVDEARSYAALMPVVESVKQRFSGLEVSGPAWHTFVVYI